VWDSSDGRLVACDYCECVLVHSSQLWPGPFGTAFSLTRSENAVLSQYLGLTGPATSRCTCPTQISIQRQIEATRPGTLAFNARNPMHPNLVTHQAALWDTEFQDRRDGHAIRLQFAARAFTLRCLHDRYPSRCPTQTCT